MSADTRLVPFVCMACHAHLRLPAQYLGKPIFCPKCNHPQRFQDADQPLEPMDTTRALRADENPSVPSAAKALPTGPAGTSRHRIRRTSRLRIRISTP